MKTMMVVVCTAVALLSSSAYADDFSYEFTDSAGQTYTVVGTSKLDPDLEFFAITGLKRGAADSTEEVLPFFANVDNDYFWGDMHLFCKEASVYPSETGLAMSLEPADGGLLGYRWQATDTAAPVITLSYAQDLPYYSPGHQVVMSFLGCFPDDSKASPAGFQASDR